jgi:hypothetical protein
VRVGRAISLTLAEARMSVLVTYRTSPAAAEKIVADMAWPLRPAAGEPGTLGGLPRDKIII